jgi:ABC-2 type transport system permease protein
MKNLFRLTAVILKGNGLSNLVGEGRRKRKTSKVGSIILLIFLAVYMGAIVTAGSLAVYELLKPVNLQGMLISAVLSAGVLLTFLFGILYVISVFYHASDIEKLLPLPLPGDQIIGAKLLVTLVYEYIYLVILFVPPLTVYGIREGQGILYYLFAVIIILVLPLIPLCLASILVMLVMRFTPFARNKDRFSLIASILAMVLALSFSFGLQSLASFKQADLIRMIQTGAGQVARITSSLFPGTANAAAALEGTQDAAAFGNLALVLLIAAAAAALTLLAGRLLYFKGVVGLTASSAGRRKLTSREMERAGTGSSAFWSYVLKDTLILLRTPIFFLNNVMMNFLWPVFFLVPLLARGDSGGLAAIVGEVRPLLFGSDPAGPARALAICFGVACFVTGTNGIAESALSREGKQFYFVKMLPMSYFRQIWAKLTVGMILSLIGALILVVLFSILFQPPFWFILLLLAMLPGSILIPNLSGIIFELFWPKLSWDNEAMAVKQNMNVVYGIMLAIALAALAIVPVFSLRLAIQPAALLIIILPLAISAFLAVFVRRLSSRRITALDV